MRRFTSHDLAARARDVQGRAVAWTQTGRAGRIFRTVPLDPGHECRSRSRASGLRSGLSRWRPARTTAGVAPAGTRRHGRGGYELISSELTRPRAVRRRAGAAFVSAALVLSLLGVLFPARSDAVPLSGVTGVTNTPNDVLNLRSCADASCAILRTIPHGTTLTLSQTSGDTTSGGDRTTTRDWFKTSYAGATGWVRSGLVSGGVVRRYIYLQGTFSTAISRGNTSRRMVSYTFDAGADLGFTGPILSHLKSNGIPSSFGLTGKWVNANPTYAQRIVADGHHLINHTWDHPSLTGLSTGTYPLSPASRLWQLETAENKFKSVMGRGSKPYFRPPYGDIDDTVRRDVGADGFTRTIMWTLDSLGWKGLTSQQICDRVKNAVNGDSRGGNGMILLFHVGSQSQDANALPCTTSFLRSKGLTFGTVPQVIAP
jgi:peptidoglycan/xylan/chitin deacetylase (PgdA/CDA1 family)